jgi:hypothetical protein
MKTLITLASLFGVAALGGGAGPAGKAAISPPGVDAAATATADTCFNRRDIRNHTVGGPKTLYLDVAGRGVYRIEMSNSCLASAVSSDPLIMRNDTGSQSVCKPIDLDITVSAAGPSKCIVSSIAKLSPVEVAALPRKMRP